MVDWQGQAEEGEVQGEVPLELEMGEARHLRGPLRKRCRVEVKAGLIYVVGAKAGIIFVEVVKEDARYVVPPPRIHEVRCPGFVQKHEVCLDPLDPRQQSVGAPPPNRKVRNEVILGRK